jgi:hypothetical protein
MGHWYQLLLRCPEWVGRRLDTANPSGHCIHGYGGDGNMLGPTASRSRSCPPIYRSLTRALHCDFSAITMVDERPPGGCPFGLAGDRGYDTREFVESCRTPLQILRPSALTGACKRTLGWGKRHEMSGLLACEPTRADISDSACAAAAMRISSEFAQLKSQSLIPPYTGKR